MSETLKGTCLCGGVEYEVTDPQALGYCHCTRCQRLDRFQPGRGGGGEGELQVHQGEDLVKTYESQLAPRNFCSNCGSSLYDDLGAVYFVAAGLMPDLDLLAQLPPAGGLQGELAPDRRRRAAVRRDAAGLTAARTRRRST